MTDYLKAEHHPNCYPSEPKAALNFFRKAFDSFSANELPACPAKKTIAGVIMPHIDFRVSLSSYTAAFHPLLNEPLAGTYLILGVGHQSRLEWNFDQRDYVTPLGRVSCAEEWVDLLAEGAPPGQQFSPEAHHGEHSIEFALVWLQALHQLHPAKGKKDFRFVPLLCGGLYHYVERIAEWQELADFHRLSRNLARLFTKIAPGEKLRVIVSIDGCHIGPRFHHPFRVTPTMLKATAHWEEKLWACAAAGDACLFLDWFREEGNARGFDGVGALALLLAAGAGKFTLQRTLYEQWFAPRDASVVTFSSGCVLI
jgi:AmmeMemoRadiSam system protein B